MKSVMSILIAFLVGLFPYSCSGRKIDNSTVRSLDLNRYLGDWYEIARFDHSFERGLIQAKANYSLKEDGTISVTNTGLKKGKKQIAIGKAKLTDTVGLLRVSFFGPFYSDYRVMMLSDDYNVALVGSASAKYLWILSRTPDVQDSVLSQILKEATDRGYDIEKLIWVDQGR